ncbi:MAG: cation:proton antiporter [Janthinobacterium lividum]
METLTVWYLLVGVLLISMGLAESLLQRLPLSPAMFYLPIGYFVGPAGLGLLQLDLHQHAESLAIVCEVALLVSLFSVGLKLRVPFNDRIWRLPLRLGIVAMLITITMLTAVGWYALGLSLGAAILLAAILAPTDPILASDVQIKDVGDRDGIRFSLSGEGGMNDGTTYPIVMLGLGLLAVPQASTYATPWGFALAFWGITAGAGSGLVSGWAVGRLVIYLRRHFRTALGMEEFLTLGLIALSYGFATLIHGIGFVAVFATGVAMRRIEWRASGDSEPRSVIASTLEKGREEVATDVESAPAYMTEMVLGFNKQLENIAEFVMVLLLGVLLSGSGFSVEGMFLALLLFIVIRPVSVLLSLIGYKKSLMQTGLLAWFGIRGIGSLYYLMFVLQYNALHQQSDRFVSIVLTVIAMSVVIHGISSTPLMDWYYRRQARRGAQARDA